MILYLGPMSPLVEFIESNEPVLWTRERVDVQFVDRHRPDFIVSYNYQHILRRDVLETIRWRAINLHISYLPWNRGADPNIWSLIDDTPKGVTIHCINEGIDTGDILAQEIVSFDYETDTLETSYLRLQRAIQELFKRHWRAIRAGDVQRQPQDKRKGSYHSRHDVIPYKFETPAIYSTPISKLREYAAEVQMSQQFFERYDSELEGSD